MPDDRLDGVTVLVVEDSFGTASLLGEFLTKAGAAKVLLAANVQQAMLRIQEAAPNAAVLDINLGTETVELVADQLTELRVPFIFCTGYGDAHLLSMKYADYPSLAKPCPPERIVRALVSILKSGRGAESGPDSAPAAG